MLTTEGTSALIGLEDAAPDFLFATLPGTSMPIWPYLRMGFAHAMATAELGAGGVSRRTTRAQAIRRVIRSYLPDFSRARYSGRVVDALYIVSGVTVSATDGGVENWLVDRFVKATDSRSVVIQDRPLEGLRRQRVNPNTYTLDAALARAEVATALAPLPTPSVQVVKDVIRKAAKAIDFELTEEAIAGLIAPAVYALSRVKHVDSQYERLLDRMRPKLVLMEDASYGSRASVISIMKDRGIRVVEPQHGWIGASHAAYNFGAAMASPSLLKTLPDTLLTFGDFWSSSIRHPAEVVSIGKPHLESKSHAAAALSERPQELLVVSSVADPEGTAALVLNLRDRLPEDWRVVFRAHPSEREVLDKRYSSLVNAERVSFDSNSDVYDSLRQVRGVVGFASTVLYEALAMGTHVFVMDSPFAEYYMDDLFGAPIDGIEGLSRVVETLLDPQAALPSVTIRDAIWKSDAETNFKNFISTLT